MPQTIEQALRENAAVEGLTRVDVGYWSHNTDTPFIVTVWFDVPPDCPSGCNGCASGHAATIDDALTLALADKDAELAKCAAPIAEAA